MTKLLEVEIERRKSIINNTSGEIYVSDNGYANKHARINIENYSTKGNLSGGKLAIEAMIEYGAKAEQESLRQGVDPLLVKSICIWRCLMVVHMVDWNGLEWLKVFYQ